MVRELSQSESEPIVWEVWGEHGAILRLPIPQPTPAGEPIPCTAILQEENFALEHGGLLPELRLRFETYGRLNARKDNAYLVFHALTGSAHLAGTYGELALKGLNPLEQAFGPQGWWDELVGAGKPLDPAQQYVICANHIGSCYGSTGPLTPNPQTGLAYGPTFPRLTIRDLARAQARLLDLLGVEKVTVIGGSLGGMVALEFALLFPERVGRLVVLAAPPVHGPWARAFNRLSRDAITADPAYNNGHYSEQPLGLQLARSIAMLSYRAPESFAERWQQSPERGESYVVYQGEKFIRRFDANAYITLSLAMDTHDVGRGRGGIGIALESLQPIPSLFVGIDTDVLYTASEVRDAAELAGGRYEEIQSPHGHDAFLIEMDQVGQVLRSFL